MANPNLPLVSVPVLMIELHGRLFQQATINTFYYMGDAGSPDPSATLNAYLTDFWEARVGPEWCDCVSAQWTVTHVLGRWINDPTLTPWVNLPGAAVDQGTIAGDCLPPANSVAHYRRSVIAGRHGRGMIRISGIPEANQVDGVLTAGAVTLHDALNVELEASLTVAGFHSMHPCCTQRPFPDVAAAPVRAALITGFSVNPILGTQNSRKIGRGA